MGRPPREGVSAGTLLPTSWPMAYSCPTLFQQGPKASTLYISSSPSSVNASASSSPFFSRPHPSTPLRRPLIASSLSSPRPSSDLRKRVQGGDVESQVWKGLGVSHVKEVRDWLGFHEAAYGGFSSIAAPAKIRALTPPRDCPICGQHPCNCEDSDLEWLLDSDI